MKKKMGKKSRRWLQEFLGHYYTIDLDRNEIARELRGDEKKALRMLKAVHPWGALYLHSPAEVILTFFSKIGMLHRILQLAQSEKSVEDYQRLFADLWYGDGGAIVDARFDAMDEKERGDCFTWLFAMIGNMDAMRAHSVSISELMLIARGTDVKVADEAIFQAVLVDRVTLSNPIVAKRIAVAQITHDESFLTELTKAIRRTKPRRKHELDDFRYMAEVIDEIEGLESYTIEELTELFTNELQILPADISSDAVRKNLAKRNERRSRK